MVAFFDIDETLLDQRRAEAAAASALLAAYGDRLSCPGSVAGLCARWRHLRAKYAARGGAGRLPPRELRRLRMRELCAGAALSDTEIDALLECYLEHYRCAWRLFDDVLPCLEALAGRCTLGIISNGHFDQQQLKLERLGLAGRFATVVVAESHGAAKPCPEIFRTACRLAGADPAACAYVGDQLEVDARASRRAGLRGIWLDRSGCGGSDACGETIHTLDALPKLLQAAAVPGRRRSARAAAGRSA